MLRFAQLRARVVATRGHGDRKGVRLNDFANQSYAGSQACGVPEMTARAVHSVNSIL